MRRRAHERDAVTDPESSEQDVRFEPDSVFRIGEYVPLLVLVEYLLIGPNAILKCVEVKRTVPEVGSIPDEEKDSEGFRHCRRVAPRLTNEPRGNLVHGIPLFAVFILPMTF